MIEGDRMTGAYSQLSSGLPRVLQNHFGLFARCYHDVEDLGQIW